MKVFWQQCEGQVIDGFPLRQYLGGGENHAVLAIDLHGHPARKAAIKLSHADPESSEFHLRQWRLASELSHPNLMRLFERGAWTLNNVPLLYVVMEFADEDLSQVIPERPLTTEEAKEVLEPALSALAYLHSHGFVHGHLKPSNFMAIENRLKISSDRIVQIGTPSAMPADDSWGLGMTLVEVLTQRTPVSNTQGEPLVPETLPAEFRDIARNTLRRDREQRWTIAEIEQRLGGKMPSVRPIPTKPIPIASGATQKPASTQSAIGSKRFSASAVSTILLASALVVVAGTLMIRNRDGSPIAPATATQAPQSAPVQPPPAKPSPLAAHPVERKETKPAQLARSKGEIVQEVMPDVLPRARNTIRGKVTAIVHLEVDPSGNVANAKIQPPVSSQYFSEAAVKAARRWKFAPADQPRVWTVKFEFTRGGTKVATTKSG